MASSLFEQMGGKVFLDRVVEFFYARVLLDPSLQPFFANTDLKVLHDHQVQFLSYLTGGPFYKGKSMKEAHQNLHVTTTAFETVLGYLTEALERENAPEAAKTAILNAAQTLRTEIIEVPDAH